MTDTRFELDDSDTENRRNRLDADGQDPRISVSTIGEYVFCPRAGLLSHESRIEDHGEEQPSFDLLPRYEQQAIGDAVTRKSKLWMISLAVFLAVSCGSVWLTPDQGVSRTAILVLVSAFLLAMTYLIVGQTRDMVVLLWRRHHSFSGVARDFDFDDGEIHPVLWWDFYESGFESQKPQPMFDENWKLDGKPWRILVKGSEYIPVFRARKAHEKPKPQQIAKVMAYCHLILATQGRVSPFGVILYGKSYEGVAVPNEHRHRNRFHTALLAVRKMVRESEEGRLPDVPSQTVRCLRCLKCPRGRPRRLGRIQPTMQYGKKLDPNILESNHGKLYHCDCGDRFAWIPPHQYSEELDLKKKET